ncbi:hypothetical protein RHGRI_008033 [Rhododendron griersonianum]|uniref:Uncharacterized protein n=1 Tax=Rhododendron griersonianum TaxID=479676 RepID=A0AAV6KZY4_9ERIC|nr:hypothetical protein RHGRI_008033 [Rhododendron griersonianum]
MCPSHSHFLSQTKPISSPVLDEASIGEVDDDELTRNDEEDFEEGGGPVVSDEEDFRHHRLRRRTTITALSHADYFSFAALSEIMIANSDGEREDKPATTLQK